MIQNLYFIIVVVLRIAALWFVVAGASTFIFMTVLGGNMTRSGLMLAPSLLPLVGGIVLWFLAKRVALLVTSGLD